jgi:hypothetical protein
VQSAASEEPTLAIVCECADPYCAERITLTPAEYDAAHNDPAQFTIVPGHATLDVEEVVARNDRFEVMRKRGLAGGIAAELDAR